MKRVTRDCVSELIDFAPTEAAKKSGFAEHQLEGTVALYNMLAQNRCAYLADEVGMGKTYVALGVMGLLRYFNPLARIVVIAPRENLQKKWIKELKNFVRLNWKVTGNRVKSLQSTPAWEPVACASLIEFSHEVMLSPDRDFFLRMPSFSVSFKTPERRKKLRKAVKELLPWLPRGSLGSPSPEGFRDKLGVALNAAVPPIDLLVVDEAHNLKKGFEKGGSTRNRLLGLVFGNQDYDAGDADWYGPRVRRALFLSATPFEEDFRAMQRQLGIFGFGDAKLRDCEGYAPQSMVDLSDPAVSEPEKKALASRVLVRRVSGLRIGGELYTRNMYRREWRQGGLREAGKPLHVTDPKQRLVVGLVQKKVAEILGDERFNNQFQMGMLSSFESFLESVARKKASAGEDSEDENVFDGEQDASVNERRGVDTDSVSRIATSYREQFGERLPHPKLDATVDALREAFDSGEKSLVFVRRVATVDEMAARLEAHYDRWIRRRMEDALPALSDEIAAVFERYERERAVRPGEERWLGGLEAEEADDGTELDEQEEAAERSFVGADDEGGAESFFSWFFRGAQPRGILSGAAFQKNRLASVSSAFATVFEDNYVAALLEGRAAVPVIADRLKISEAAVSERLRDRAYCRVRRYSKGNRYPRLYVFEGYQLAALEALAETEDGLGERAETIIQERFESPELETGKAPDGFPDADEYLDAQTFFRQLEADESLCAELWPADATGPFREQFRRREQRRELISALCRLGAPFIDLYLIAIARLGTFKMREAGQVRLTGEDLASSFLEHLRQQRDVPGHHAYRELAEASTAFDTLLAVNFPDVPHAHLHELAGIYGQTLQRQVPVGRMSGGVSKRLVRQFRMPGYPLVLVTTDVLQEGEDLHTFCRQVVHYGISWTPSSMEQRTGRVNRIGSLIQRRYDGQESPPNPDECLQVFYPYLRDTVEVLQVRRVFRRLNRFLSLIHRMDRSEPNDSRVDAAREILEDLKDIAPISGRLESAFPVDPRWEVGEAAPEEVISQDLSALEQHLDELWADLEGQRLVKLAASSPSRAREGRAWVDGAELVASDANGRELSFDLELRSQAAGDATLLRCSSREVLRLDPNDGDAVWQLYHQQVALGGARVCARPDTKHRDALITIEESILFDPRVTQAEEVRAMLARVLTAAAAIHRGDDVASTQGRLAKRKNDTTEIEVAIDRLIKARRLPWTRTKNKIAVNLPDNRRQFVSFRRRGDLYIFSSRVARANQIYYSNEQWLDLVYRVWRKNALSELAGYAFNTKEDLIGLIEQPVATLDPDELYTYVNVLARECDRFEFVLTGDDYD